MNFSFADKDDSAQSNPSTVSSIAFDGADKKKEDDFLIQAPAITLPQGGGAIKSIDEKFSVNAVNGTGTITIPLPIAAARPGTTPSLELSYNSGSGNTAFGLGWNVEIPSISRKTDKGIPRYWDDEESDTFLITGAEDLVPQLQLNGENWERVADPQAEDGIQYMVSLYRPRIEGPFTRIEKWTNILTGDTHWRTITRDNIYSVFGKAAESRISDPDDQRKVFRWLLSHSCDDKGNLTTYQYKTEDFSAIENQVFEKNKPGHCTNVYIKQVLYGNKTPFTRGQPMPVITDFMFRLVFDYGEHEPAGLGFHTNINHDIPADVHLSKNDWHYRKDAFSQFRAGFDIRTYRRCRRIMSFHCFEELRNTAAPCLVQSLELVYNEQLLLESTMDTIDGFSYLARIIRKGHQLNDTGTAYDSRALPPLDFTYQQMVWNTAIKEVTIDNVQQPPSPGNNLYQWLDLYSEGLPGILTDHGSAWYYKHNLGNGEFAAAELISPKPSFSGLTEGHLSIRELEGNGKKYAVGYSGAQQGFFGLTDSETWETFKAFDQLPNLDFKDPNLKWIDINGDGLPDLLLSEEDIFLWYPAKGEKGFDTAAQVIKPTDEEKGPAVVFADSVQCIYLTDMAGHGLTDIVRIRNGEVCYWANKGYGRFSAKITMGNAPVFDHPDKFNPAFLRLADIDGSGTTDIIYLGHNEFRVWSNLNGNTWRQRASIINPVPDINQLMEVTVSDLLGTGTSCIIWASALPGDQLHPLRYIDFTDSRKPHLMTGYLSNTGKRVSFQYKSSTQFYLEDKKAGKSWVTKLPFPVHVLSQTEIQDEISKARFVSAYTYHHGYYDGMEREFRGFGRVDQLDTEIFTDFIRNDASNIVDKTLHQPPVLTRSWFHTGTAPDSPGMLQQFRHEYYQNDFFTEYHLPDAHIILPGALKPEDMSATDHGEALRACKNKMLRKEVYALDGSEKEPIPYTVVEQNCHIRMLQPRKQKHYAVFLPEMSEGITYQYEREPSDPRIKHDLNLDIDEYNNILLSATVVYPRAITNPLLPLSLQDEIALLPALVKKEQTTLHIVLSTNSFTNDIKTNTDHRLRSKAVSQNWELTGCKPAATYFSLEELKNFSDIAVVIPYTATPGMTLQKRMLSHERVLFAADDAVTPLPLLQQASKGFRHESYRLAFTNQLLVDIYAARVDAVLLGAAQYRQGATLQPLFPVTDAADDWWMPSGKNGYPVNPANHFFLPDKIIDPYGKITLASFDAAYHLFIPLVQDAIGNETGITSYNFRVLQPAAVKDANDNITEIRFDIAGMVVGLAQKGKGAEADDFTGFQEDMDQAAINNFFNDPVLNGAALLQNATSRIVYDWHHLPLSAATIIRERHHQDVLANGVPDKLQYSFEYSGGTGKVLMKKVQTTPGQARFIDDADQLQIADTSPNLRWIGSGRTVFNNKGNPVKQYQPYFSTNHRYEDDRRLVVVGPTNILFYDPTGRNIRSELPNETFSINEYGPWKQRKYDNNDTVKTSPWYIKRFNRQIDAVLIAEGKDPVKEQEAAVKAAKHDGTPVAAHFDSLGRTVLQVLHNKDLAALDVFHETIVNMDIKGNIQSIVDALGVSTMRYKYDITGTEISQTSADSGTNIVFNDVMKKKIRRWDSRNHTFLFTYDDLHRPLALKVTGGDGDILLDHVISKFIYGEGRPDDKLHNLRTQTWQTFDQSGIITHPDFDFTGTPLRTSRQFCTAYNVVIDWNAPVAMEEDIFESSIAYDALKRAIAVVAPHSAGNPASAYFPVYNESSMLGSMEVSIRGGARTAYVTGIGYNEKGSRTEVRYGNNTRTVYTYDKATFHLLRLRTTRAAANGFASGLLKDPVVLQDTHYVYDPMGNITSCNNDALRILFFDGEEVKPLVEYEYDALYQLIHSSGRKHAGQTDIQHTGAGFNYRNQPFIPSGAIDPNDINAFRNFRETYKYDKNGNMLEQRHIAKDSNWTRTFEYTYGNNQLSKTIVGAFDKTYTYDTHGNLDDMEHLSAMHWTTEDDLQHVNLGGGGHAWYNYDTEQQRTRKVTELPGGAIKERLYVGSMEIYREKNNLGQITLQRETLQLMDDKQRVAMADTETTAGVAAATLVRYQYSDHLGSVSLELDDVARVITFEEYFAFGATSFSTADAAREIPARRYRYSGKERDEESGLSYHGARYYAPWICRWTAADRLKKKEAYNRYVYVNNNPVIYLDDNGAFEEPVHGATTYHLALAAGFTPTEAAQIALATAGMDHDPATAPGWNERTQTDHFEEFDVALANVNTAISGITPASTTTATDTSLAAFGRRLHTLEDVGFEDAPGPHRRHGGPALDRTMQYVGLALTPTALGFIGVGIAGVLSGGTGNTVAGVVSIVFGGIFAAVAIALFIASALDVSKGIGHPIYETEIGNQSNSFSHIADEAYQDPRQNRAELLRIYDVLKTAARARHGDSVVVDDDRASAIIGDIEDPEGTGVVNANTGTKILDYLDMPGEDNYGNTAPSYADVVRANNCSRVPGITVGWTDSKIDITVNDFEVTYHARHRVRACTP